MLGNDCHQRAKKVGAQADYLFAPLAAPSPELASFLADTASVSNHSIEHGVCTMTE